MTAATTARGRKPQGNKKAQAKKPDDRKLMLWGLVTAISTAALSGLVTYCVNVQSAEYQVQLTDRAAQVNRFVESAEAFDPLVAKFVQEISQGDIAPITRETIKANLMKQHSTLESAEVGLTNDARKWAEDYRAALVVADTGLQNSTQILNSRQFVQAAADIAALRPAVIKVLREKH